MTHSTGGYYKWFALPALLLVALFCLAEAEEKAAVDNMTASAEETKHEHQDAKKETGETATTQVTEAVSADISGATEINETSENTAVQEAINFYTQQVDKQLIVGDSFSPALAESLFGLGRAYREQKNYAVALEKLNQALHIERVSNGLLNLSQEPLLRELITTNLALGDWDSSVRNMAALDQIYLHEYGRDHVERVPLMSELSQRHLQAYIARDYTHGEHLVAANSYAQEAVRLLRKYTGENDLQIAQHLRHSALSNYYLALLVGEQDEFSNASGFYFGPEDPLREDIIRRMYSNVYRNGRQDYEDLVNLLYTNPEATHLQRAIAHAELGDWYLMFGKKDSALSAYRDSLAYVEDPEEREEIRKQIFSPLVGLPAVAVEMEQHVNDAVTRVVEVEMDINRYGQVKKVDVLNIDGQDTVEDDQASKIRRIMKTQRFRPLLEDDQLASREKVRQKFRLEL